MENRNNMAAYGAEHHTELHPELRIADLVESNYKLLPVLERFNIELGFGESTIAEKCAELGITVDFFILVCNIHTHDKFKVLESDIELLSAGSIESVLSYLNRSHTYYLEHSMPLLKGMLSQISACCQTTHTVLLERFLESYQQEIENHFDYEEQVVFPYIQMLMQGDHATGYSIDKFEENHSNIDEKINDLKSILLKYITVSSGAEIQYRILFDIYRLEEDINKHTLIEEGILVPLVERLERELISKKGARDE